MRILNESERELLRDERVRVSLEIPSGIPGSPSLVCPYVPMALVNAVVSVGGEREPLARAAKDGKQRDEERNRGA